MPTPPNTLGSPSNPTRPSRSKETRHATTPAPIHGAAADDRRGGPGVLASPDDMARAVSVAETHPAPDDHHLGRDHRRSLRPGGAPSGRDGQEVRSTREGR